MVLQRTPIARKVNLASGLVAGQTVKHKFVTGWEMHLSSLAKSLFVAPLCLLAACSSGSSPNSGNATADAPATTNATSVVPAWSMSAARSA